MSIWINTIVCLSKNITIAIYEHNKVVCITLKTAKAAYVCPVVAGVTVSRSLPVWDNCHDQDIAQYMTLASWGFRQIDIAIYDLIRTVPLSDSEKGSAICALTKLLLDGC